MTDAEPITDLLREVSGGSREASDLLFEAVYDDLRRLAASRLRGERPEHTLQATALVHEAYLRLIDQTRVDWKNRSHFLAIAARAMRRLLVDHARHRGREKRGGDLLRVTLTEDPADGGQSADRRLDVLALEEALERLSAREPAKARVVELRYFGGLSAQESAHVLGVSSRTVERHWLHARAWLHRELRAGTAE